MSDSELPGSRPRLLVIIGSTRPGRAGLPIAQWFVERAREHGEFEIDVADLAEINLPLLDEPNHPRLGQYLHDHTKAWSAQVRAADAIVLVTAEYNHGYTAPLKNAIDYLHTEWQHKPVAFVSYGGIAAGIRAVEQLKPVVATLSMMPLVENVSIPFHSKMIEDGVFHGNESLGRAAAAMLRELERWSTALRILRVPAAV